MTIAKWKLPLQGVNHDNGNPSSTMAHRAEDGAYLGWLEFGGMDSGWRCCLSYCDTMTELLRPEEVREMLGKTFFKGSARLCRDYLALWRDVKDLKDLLDAEGIYRGEPID